MPKLSEQLKELMDEDGYTQTSLAKAMSTSRAKLSLYLSDRSLPNYGYFVRLIEFFNCSADFLIGKSDYPERAVKYGAVQPFGARLRKLLADGGVSQYSFIKQTGISWNVFYNWLIGKSLPSLDSLIKLSNFFGCSVDFLLGRQL